MKNVKSALKSRAFRAGGYSIITAVVVIIIAVVINMLVGKLPLKYTQVDLTANQLFTLSEQSAAMLSSMDEDVTIYWIVPDGAEDSYIERMLNAYADGSKHIKIEKINPVLYPNFTAEYTTEALYSNSLIVERGDRYRVVNYTDIFIVDLEAYYATGAVSYDFDGEGALASAVSYVISDETPVVYALTGHGEATLSVDMKTSVERQNLSLQTLTLNSAGAVPEDCSALFIFNPQSDITTAERDMILDYLKGGGNLMLLSSHVSTDGLPNLEEVMEYYGITAANGVLIEGDSSRMLYNYPHYIIPTLRSHDITSPLLTGGYQVITPIAQGLVISEELRETLTVTELIKSSDASFVKTAGYDLTTYEKEDGDLDGPFSVGVAATETVDDVVTNVVWIGSSMLIDAETNTYSSGANEDMFLNSISWMCDVEEGISIHAKSLDAQYLTVPGNAKTLLTFAFVILIPTMLLGLGVFTLIVRRKK